MTTPPNSRFDAADSFFIQQQLTSLDPNKYYNLVPGIVGRRYIPRIEAASPDLPVYKYVMTKLLGRTKKSGPRGKAGPTSQVVRTEKTHTIKTFEATPSWTVDEVRASRASNSSLDDDTILAAVTSIEQDFDSALCLGISGTDATGLANNADIGHTDASDKGSGDHTWNGGAADPDEIIGDVKTLIAEALADLKQAQVPGMPTNMFQQFALWLPLEHYNLIDMTPRSTQSDTTILQFISKFAALKAVIPWWRLDTADAGDPMAVLVPCLDSGVMNPLAGGALLPMDFERLPEQYSGRTVSVPCAGKCGGVPIRFPVAFRYLKKL